MTIEAEREQLLQKPHTRKGGKTRGIWKTKWFAVLETTKITLLSNSNSIQFKRDALKVMKPTGQSGAESRILSQEHKSHREAQIYPSTNLSHTDAAREDLRIKQNCIRRENSTFHISSESKDAVIPTLAVINASVDPLSQ